MGDVLLFFVNYVHHCTSGWSGSTKSSVIPRQNWIACYEMSSVSLPVIDAFMRPAPQLQISESTCWPPYVWLGMLMKSRA